MRDLPFASRRLGLAFAFLASLLFSPWPAHANPKPLPKLRSIAFLVGSKGGNLSYTGRDVYAMADVLHRSGGLQPEDLYLLSDDNAPPEDLKLAPSLQNRWKGEPTRENIGKGFQWLEQTVRTRLKEYRNELLARGIKDPERLNRILKKGVDEISPGDKRYVLEGLTLWVIFSGHGRRYAIKDHPSGWSWVIVPDPDSPFSDEFKNDDVAAHLHGLRSKGLRSILYISDACHSGLPSKPKASPSRVRPSPSRVRASKKKFKQGDAQTTPPQSSSSVRANSPSNPPLVQGEGMITIGSSTYEQMSEEDERQQQGFLIGLLLQGLKGAADPSEKDGVIHFAELWAYLLNASKKHARRFKQVFTKTGNEIGILPLAIYEIPAVSPRPPPTRPRLAQASLEAPNIRLSLPAEPRFGAWPWVATLGGVALLGGALAANIFAATTTSVSAERTAWPFAVVGYVIGGSTLILGAVLFATNTPRTVPLSSPPPAFSTSSSLFFSEP